MKTQLSFSRIVRESGTTLVVTMGLYLVLLKLHDSPAINGQTPALTLEKSWLVLSCTVAMLPTANYRQEVSLYSAGGSVSIYSPYP